MDKNNLFIFVTRGGAIFDRTNGKNERMVFGKEYSATNGVLKFSRGQNEKITIVRTSANGKVAYTKELAETGLYIVTPLFVHPLPRTSKDVRLLYNKVKNIGSKPKFKIIEDTMFDEPLKIQFVAKNDGGVLETRFTLKVNPDLLRSEHVDEAAELITRATKLDLYILLKDFNIENNHEVMMTINDHFIETRLILENLAKKKDKSNQ